MADKINYYKAIIFLHGDKTNVSRVKKHIDSKTLIIGCDGGTQYAIDIGFVPHVVIGDMDSIPAKLKKELENKKIKFISYPAKKDNTDAELALLYAIKKGCKEIILTGILGSRIDHLLATIHMLANPKFKNINLRLIEGNQDLYIVRNHIRLTGKKGDLVSLVPLNDNVQGITTQNLTYTLKNKVLKSYETLGVSNVMTKNLAEITLKKGILLVIHQS